MKITLVSCNKSNFNMYILNNNRVPMSLLNLNLSSLYQNKLNAVLNLTTYVVPKTLSQQAPQFRIRLARGDGFEVDDFVFMFFNKKRK